ELTGDEWKVDSLDPAEKKVFETSYKVTKADAEAGVVLNVATVTGNKPEDPDNPDDPDDPIEEKDEEPNPTVVKLVIRYWVDGKFDHQITRYEKPGTKYDVVSPPKAGYTVDIERVKGTLTKDTEYDVHYTRTEYTLTILYQYEDGTTAADTYTATLNAGSAYSVTSPVIDGYHTNLTIVEGTMPARNVTVTVIYVKNPNVPNLITIDDFLTPLGLGLGGLNAGETIE
ncbi:MAG: MucBP domain-containing protein, partial [Lachnospiraceae bacterium]|nr:MucBP domain-containing protein [Lachnospiraceae bacterium]